MRGTIASVERVAGFIHYLNQSSVFRLEHMPIELRGEKTLHLDYAANYCGIGASRCMMYCPAAIANQNDIERLRWVFQATEKNLIELTQEEMLAAAGNPISLDPQTVIMRRHSKVERVSVALEERGLTVRRHRLEQAKKDGGANCSELQVYRA
jgi:N-dimethylarginine dimethylaminohydrolase